MAKMLIWDSWMSTKCPFTVYIWLEIAHQVDNVTWLKFIFILVENWSRLKILRLEILKLISVQNCQHLHWHHTRSSLNFEIWFPIIFKLWSNFFKSFWEKSSLHIHQYFTCSKTTQTLQSGKVVSWYQFRIWCASYSNYQLYIFRVQC